MSVRFTPYLPMHLHQFVVQPGQAWLSALQEKPGYAEELATGGLAFSGFNERDELLGCAGFIGQGDCRAIVWALFSRAVRPHDFLAIHRKVLAEMAIALRRWDRIEAYLDPTFTNSVYWAQKLGFTPRAQLPCYFPGRRTALLVDLIAPVREPFIRFARGEPSLREGTDAAPVAQRDERAVGREQGAEQ